MNTIAKIHRFEANIRYGGCVGKVSPHVNTVEGPGLENFQMVQEAGFKIEPVNS